MGANYGLCNGQHKLLVQCVASNLKGNGGGYSACARDFAAVRKAAASSIEEDDSATIKRGWACAWKYFHAPLELLLSTAEALGECRPSNARFVDTEMANEAKYRAMWKGTAL